MIQNWKIYDKIGDGSYGRVWLASHSKTKEIAAIKNTLKTKETAREAELFSIIDHPNLTKLLDKFEIDNNYWFVMKYYPTTLLDHIQRQDYGHLTVSESHTYFLQLLGAVEYLHRMG